MMVETASHDPLKALRGAPDQPPQGVRLARPGDQSRLYDLCETAFRAGDGFGGSSATRAWDVIGRACQQDYYLWGVIDGPDRMEGVVGFEPARTWYGGDDDWYWLDMITYVHPLHRNSRNGALLLSFGEWWASVCKAPVLIGLMPQIRMGAKINLFGRHGRQIGATFLLGDGEFAYATEEAA